MTICPSENELLTVEEFAAKLKVSRTTVFTWLKTGHLTEGKHYFKIGRIIRFVWDAGSFLGKPVRRKPEQATTSVKPVCTMKRHLPSEPAVNLDY